ncbi:DUF423 domain-containing protein [Paenibacillus sp. IB182496]|uniref:DUF423 domain-containing protein n=1 Tax=Paenibacillus sabuli TaxID=2772509 RepID=A0A927BUL9_9BACL|nr:DUF423 domain-containing protein [Paenibacillus sabuli]MBD2845950.1 DUF423 domain-containing protein [Paenibacillus sabuli]
MQTLLLLGSINMALAVILGAFGAHALKKRLTPEQLAIYQTGVQYHIAHALGLLLLGAIAGGPVTVQGAMTSGWLLLAGIVLFSGSLYALSLSGVRKLGAITPLGGLAFIAGWLALVWALV